MPVPANRSSLRRLRSGDGIGPPKQPTITEWRRMAVADQLEAFAELTTP
jgi:hypothetical protein